jgi:hypothetical protein
MITALGVILGVGIGLLTGTAIMGAGVAVDRANCMTRAAGQDIAAPVAAKICNHRASRRAIEADPGAWDVAVERAKRRAGRV